MKKLLKPYRHLAALFAVCLLAVAVIMLGAPLITGVAIVACWQLSQFAMSKRCGRCFTTALTPEQLKEFEGIVKGLAEYRDLFPQIKDLACVEGGFAAIKALPHLLKQQSEVSTQLRADLDGVRRMLLASHKEKSGHVVRLANGDLVVSDDCARLLGSIYCAAGVQQGFITDQKRIDTIAGVFKELHGVEMRTALSSSDIPLPVLYSSEIVELVSAYGAARKYGTVFPLGAGSVKLPYLSTDPTFTVNLISAAVTEKSPALTHVTFTPEKFGGLVRLPTEIDEDSLLPMGQFLARWAARGVARSEDHNFFAGTGTVGTVNGDVEGLQFSTITNSKVTQMGSTKTHYSDLTLAHLRAVRAIPDAPALGRSAYYMHPTMEQQLAGLNTAGDKPYNPAAQIQGTGANPFMTGPTLDGFPIRWVDVMPAYSTSANASKVFVLFGDLSFQYLGVRRGIAVDTSREAGFTTDEILVRALERFTIGLMALGAVGGIETAAS